APFTAARPGASATVKWAMGWGPLFPLERPGGGGSVASPGPGGAGGGGEGNSPVGAAGSGSAGGPNNGSRGRAARGPTPEVTAGVAHQGVDRDKLRPGLRRRGVQTGL